MTDPRPATFSDAPPATRGRQVLAWIPLGVCLAAAFLLWMAFRPGLYSFDSLSQYEQALTGKLDDWHPPVVAAVLSLVLRIGGGPSQVVLVQCLLGMCGVYYLACQVLRLLPQLSRLQIRWCALLAVAVLLLPWSPLGVYLVTFWKDIWVMVCLLWICGLSLSLLRQRERRVTPGFILQVTALLAFTILGSLARHNAAAILPVCCLLFAWIVARKTRWYVALAAGLLPVMSYAACNTLIYRAYAVQVAPNRDLYMGFELVGVCLRCPQAKTVLPYTSSCLADNAREKYCTGWVDLSLNAWNPPGHFVHPELIRAEYRKALWELPGAMLNVKWRNFRFHLQRNPCGWVQFDILPNRFGLVQDPRFADARKFLLDNLDHSFRQAALQWVFTRHGVWLIVNLALAIGLAVHGWRRRNGQLLELALVLTVPLAYYFSYLVMSCSGDFRYMYPSSLVVQILCLSLAAGLLAARRVPHWEAFRRPQVTWQCKATHP